MKIGRIGLALLLGVTGVLAALPREAAKLRTDFEAQLKATEQQGQTCLAALNDEYVEHLRHIEAKLQKSGNLRLLAVVHEEIIRFSKARSAPSGTLGAVPVELHDMQVLFIQRFQLQQYTNELQVIGLIEQYLQGLALLREVLAPKDKAAMQALDEERDRLLGLPRISQALQATAIRPAGLGNSAGTNASAPVANANKSTSTLLTLYRRPDEDLAVIHGYNLSVNLLEDPSRLKTQKNSSSSGRTVNITGQINYVPRITISCRNKSLRSGSRLVVEYFSRVINRVVNQTAVPRRREGLETILLPAIDRGRTLTVEAKGVMMNKSETIHHPVSGVTTRSNQGTEFYGLIVTLQDDGGQTILQRFSLPGLTAEIAGITASDRS
ncbi:MAG: hypothetical protein NTV49_14930 [Kiritimatiellaeota bacterium]|nr:hypothetical protein [Kiritimatiellota bacterium]